MNRTRILATALVLSLVLSACSAGAPPNASGSAPAPGSSYYPNGGAPSNEDRSYPAETDGSYPSGESYLVIDENKAKPAEQDSLLTLSLKVDTAAYTNVQRYIESGGIPPRDAVRTEELINYFRYDTPLSFGGGVPFAVYTEVAPSPFDTDKYIAFIRVKTPDINKEELPKSSLTFLIDSSGSMDSYDKLPLLKEAFGLLVETLDEDDRVSIITYAGSSVIVLDGANGGEKDRILSAINSLDAGGSTAGGEGILTAYKLAQKNFVKNGNNRVILATDGDFNVGVSSNEELSRLIRDKRDSGVYLSVLGFGTGNIRDDLMETLAKDGNGNYAYISSLRAAKKVLVEELASNLFTAADDVKAQIEFNPGNVKSYRLIGYENRMLKNKDFEDDTKDAGEIGAGTDVVMLFEIELQNGQSGPGLKYKSEAAPQSSDSTFADELFEVRIRYKHPGQSESKLVTQPFMLKNMREQASSDHGFACAVAAFGQLLRGSEYAGGITAKSILALAEDSLGRDAGGYRKEFLDLVKQYEKIA